MQKPSHIFLFLAALGLTIFGLSLLMPDEKIEVGEFQIGFYTPNDLLGSFWDADDQLYEDTLSVSYDSLFTDSLHNAVDMEEAEPKPIVLDTLLQMKEWDALKEFWLALEDLKRGKRNSVRIIHYGDSQIEGDRITMQLRNSLQAKYGGRGFGYVSLSPLVAPASMNFSDSKGFTRKTAFGNRDDIQDWSYGHLASFTMLLPNETGTGYYGEVTFKKRNWGYSLARDFRRVRLSIKTSSHALVKVWTADTLFSTRAFPEYYSGVMALDVPINEEFKLSIEAKESPRIYGISFDSPTGVHVDNVAMRGASGKVFRRLDREQFKADLEREGYALIILQYGGNTVPYLKDADHARSVALSMARQISHIRSLHPKASIIFIGPSDMARKNGLNMESYPLIKVLKQTLRDEALSRGAAYWDLQDVMGGEGSMVDWVEEDPALAAKDYIHFTTKGSQRVGDQFGEVVRIAQEAYYSEQERIAEEAQRRSDSIKALNTAKLDSSLQDSVQP